MEKLSLQMLSDKAQRLREWVVGPVLQSMIADGADPAAERKFELAVDGCIEKLKLLNGDRARAISSVLATFLNATNLMEKWKVASEMGAATRDKCGSDQEEHRVGFWLHESGILPGEVQGDALELLSLRDDGKDGLNVMVTELLDANLSAFQFAHLTRFVEFFALVLIHFPSADRAGK